MTKYIRYFLKILPFWGVFFVHTDFLIGVEAGQFYTYLAGSYLLLILLLFETRSIDHTGINIRPTDIALLFFAVVWVISYLYNFEPFQDFKLSYFLATILYYLIFRQSDVNFLTSSVFLLSAFVAPAFLQSLVAIVQSVVASTRYQSAVPVGTLFNSNPLGMYLSVGFVAALSVYRKWKGFRYRWVLRVMMASITAAMVLCIARTAWLGVFVVVLVISKKYISEKINSLFKRKAYQLSVYAVFLLAGISGVLLLWYFKPLSAQGRLYIWNISFSAIADNSIFGWGSECFGTVYNHYQQSYFVKHPGSSFAFLADETAMAFNEWIKLMVENGVVGTLAFFFAMGLLVRFYWKKTPDWNSNGAWLILICLLVESLFSYPFNIPSIRLIFIYAVATSVSITPRLLDLNKHAIKIAGVCIGIFLSFILFIHVRQYNKYLVWETAYKNSLGTQNKIDLKIYENGYPILHGFPNFLINYAYDLSEAEKYAQSNGILSEVRSKVNSIDLHIRMGYNFYKLGNYAEAKRSFSYACHLVPTRLKPRYWLVKVNDAMGNKAESCFEATTLLSTPIKVPSFQAEEIIEEIEQYRITHCDSLKSIKL